MERTLTLFFSLVAIVFSIFAFFLLDNLFLLGMMDLISLILLALALKFYNEGKHKRKYSFLKSVDKINTLKSIGGFIGVVYLSASILGILNISVNFGFNLILIIFNLFQVLIGISILSLAIWD
jgi:hypothetical protein